MGVMWRREDPLAQRVVRKVDGGTMYRVTLQRVQEVEVQFTVDDGEDPKTVAWELAAGGWETVDRNVLSMIQINDGK